MSKIIDLLGRRAWYPIFEIYSSYTTFTLNFMPNLITLALLIAEIYAFIQTSKATEVFNAGEA